MAIICPHAERSCEDFPSSDRCADGTSAGHNNEWYAKRGAIPAEVTRGSWEQWQHGYMKPLWDSIIKAEDRYKYGWDANPWVWVNEFFIVKK